MISTWATPGEQSASGPRGAIKLSTNLTLMSCKYIRTAATELANLKYIANNISWPILPLRPPVVWNAASSSGPEDVESILFFAKRRM